MKRVFGQIRDSVQYQLENGASKKAGLRKTLWWTLGIIVVLQLYFVRELLAAEMLFGLGFIALFVLVGIVYLLGIIGERGLAWSEAHVRVVADSAKRGLSMVEEVSRRPFRNPRSESAQ